MAVVEDAMREVPDRSTGRIVVGWEPAIPGHRPDAEVVLTAAFLVAASLGARLLVVGSRGHRGLPGLPLGSVSAACAGHARCPVLVVHGESG